MKRILSFFLILCLALSLFLPAVPEVSAAGEILSLSEYIRNREKRHFVEAMISYHLRENETVRQTLEDGYSALFFFEGCSDNMDNPEYEDLSYYRISAVCIALKQDEHGNPLITYFNDNCSTLPDRPLDIGQWELETEGQVGPATVCDGTYELYSVYHAGSYEALHIRTTFEDETVSAVYMTPEGYTAHPATYINIHTRTGNHTLKESMWSAGCLLVGDGDWSKFADLIVSTYYSNYGKFQVGQRVGCVTINRHFLQEEMLQLYENREAVDTLLVSSRCELPEVYLQRCNNKTEFKEKTVRATSRAEIMSLPCSNSVDARSIPVTVLDKGDKIDICGSIINTKQQLWYEVSFFGENCYIPAGSVEDVPDGFWNRFLDFFRI